MEVTLNPVADASAGLTRQGGATEVLKYRGKFQIEHFRNGELIGQYDADNGVTNQGKNRTLDDTFNTGFQSGTWYLGLIDNSGFSALAGADTYANINQVGNGWDEFASYTDPANSASAVSRPAWGQGSASSQAVTNSSVVVFDITGSGTVKGLFLVAGSTAQTKSDHTSGGNTVLWCTALFNGGDKVVASSDQLKVTFTVSL